ncbi:hypothetical protein [Oligoflexus tunisiensis]|uniref:hypothetical protein n=1 Tax=Oligoflexus tunisiensis TaxID=708132 RepID=UPI00114CBBF1|nr:hypothetical protein [Oligoflexus tunisiensis]
MNERQTCEHCREQIHCRNLYVALRILEEELRFVDRIDLWREFSRLKEDIRAAGYGYPDGIDTCTIADSPHKARALVERAERILREVRHTVSISPA